jgi:hypothetical protein
MTTAIIHDQSTILKTSTTEYTAIYRQLTQTYIPTTNSCERLAALPLQPQVPLERGLERSVLSINLHVRIIIILAAQREQTRVDVEERTLSAAVRPDERGGWDGDGLGVLADEGARDW